MIAHLLVAVFGLIVILPDGREIQAQQVDYRVGTGTVVILEAPVFRDGFE
jgi:hypothetical protein